MFAIMYNTEDGKVFKICKTLEEAQNRAAGLSCSGYEVTVFDYDIESETYLEFYTI